MGGKSPVAASDEQRIALAALAGSRDRGEADRARAVLLTLAGSTSPRIAEAFGVREDTVRLWRSDFGRGGVDALKASIAPGPPPVKSETALRVVTPLLDEPVADRPKPPAAVPPPCPKALLPDGPSGPFPPRGPKTEGGGGAPHAGPNFQKVY